VPNSWAVGDERIVDGDPLQKIEPEVRNKHREDVPVFRKVDGECDCGEPTMCRRDRLSPESVRLAVQIWPRLTVTGRALHGGTPTTLSSKQRGLFTIAPAALRPFGRSCASSRLMPSPMVAIHPPESRIAFGLARHHGCGTV
jgi:hypothetical protein